VLHKFSNRWGGSIHGSAVVFDFRTIELERRIFQPGEHPIARAVSENGVLLAHPKADSAAGVPFFVSLGDALTEPLRQSPEAAFH
jgi:hypothetical protein